MRICIIANMSAGGSESLDPLRGRLVDGVEWREADGRPAAVELGASAGKEGFDLVVAAGGDGTVNAVANGLLQGNQRPALGIIPSGTGNDLARTLALPLDPLEAAGVLREGRRMHMDVFQVRSPSDSIYGINAAAGGFSGMVDEALTPEMKETWGPLAYLIGAAAALPELQDYDTRVAFDDEPPEPLDVMNMVVANGRTVAGGRRVSPVSQIEDGLLDVVILRLGTVVELGDAAARLLAGNFLTSELVSYRRVRTVRVESNPGMWFNVDGELFTNEPVTISVLPAALEVVVGPAYRAEP